VSTAPTGLAHSVQVRLVQHAKALALDPNVVLARFATERFLYRLSRSPHAERFVLKGALLLLAWLGETIRPTRDADLLGSGDLSDEALAATCREICALEVEPDAMIYLPETIRVAAIRPEDAYGGKRVALQSRLGPARISVQLDIGIGDAVVPDPVWLEYPGLLDFPRPRLRAYRPETAIAEKLHAMVVLGSRNSRMRDFFDIHALAQRESFESAPLVDAVRATFERRRTAIPAEVPLALTAAFAQSAEKRAQWGGFIARSRLTAAPADLADVVDAVARFLLPVIDAARGGSGFKSRWAPGGPWLGRPAAGIKPR
jgi:hypothetical protein